MLGGTTRMTISITVLVMETTGSMQLIIPLMITIFFAKNIGDRYSMGIYDTHIKIRGAPFLNEPEYAGVAADKLKVAEVMADSLVTLKPVMRVRDLVNALTSTSHGAFPVTVTDVGDGHESGQPIELHGSITRNLLLKMLTHRVAMFDPEEPREVSVTRSIPSILKYPTSPHYHSPPIPPLTLTPITTRSSTRTRRIATLCSKS